MTAGGGSWLREPELGQGSSSGRELQAGSCNSGAKGSSMLWEGVQSLQRDTATPGGQHMNYWGWRDPERVPSLAEAESKEPDKQSPR